MVVKRLNPVVVQFGVTVNQPEVEKAIDVWKSLFP